MKTRHCVELGETQGFFALVAYHEKQVAKLADEPSKAIWKFVWSINEKKGG